jgi:hypothetical protein
VIAPVKTGGNLLSPNVARTFNDAENHLGSMDASVAASLLSAAADLTLVLGKDGAVLDMAYSGAELTGEGIDGWVGRPLVRMCCRGQPQQGRDHVR